MFIAIYRWKLKPGCEERFREGWRRRTMEIRERSGSFGSRLHRAEDGTWLAYAQWPDRRTWERAGSVKLIDGEAAALMRECVAENLPDQFLEVSDDLLNGG